MIEFVIFSKDRACQLDLLLRSIRLNVPKGMVWNINVLYTYSHEEYGQGYSMLMKSFPEVYFIRERDFKKNLTDIVIDTNAEFLCTLVDDDVFVRKFINNELFNPVHRSDVANLSLRLHPFMDYCYPTDSNMAPVNTTLWDWESADGDFGYPVSLSATVWKVTHFLEYLKALDFNHPNSLESAMYNNINKARSKMACYTSNPVVNIPANLVQSTHMNRHSGIDPDTLNQQYLRGGRLDLAKLQGIKTQSCFINYNHTFI